MTSIVRFLFGSAAVALLAVTAVHGWQRYFTEAAALSQARTWENAQRARFLQRCRLLIQKDSVVLALTESVPAPDFDFWIASDAPVHVLARVTDHTLAELAREGDSTPRAALEQALESANILLTGSRLQSVLPLATMVLIADLKDPAPSLPGFIQLAAEENCSLWKREKP